MAALLTAKVRAMAWPTSEEAPVTRQTLEERLLDIGEVEVAEGRGRE